MDSSLPDRQTRREAVGGRMDKTRQPWTWHHARRGVTRQDAALTANTAKAPFPLNAKGAFGILNVSHNLRASPCTPGRGHDSPAADDVRNSSAGADGKNWPSGDAGAISGHAGPAAAGVVSQGRARRMRRRGSASESRGLGCMALNPRVHHNENRVVLVTARFSYWDVWARFRGECQAHDAAGGTADTAPRRAGAWPAQDF
jgi:hypothetical protein